MSGLKSTLSSVTSVLPDNLFGLKKIYIPVCTEKKKHFQSFNSPKQLFSELLLLQLGKAATRSLYDKLFLKSLQYSKENTCVADSFW